MAEVESVQIIFQAVGGSPAQLTVDEGTTLDELLKQRQMDMANYIVVVGKQARQPDYVLQQDDLVYANRRRSHGS